MHNQIEINFAACLPLLTRVGHDQLLDLVQKGRVVLQMVSRTETAIRIGERLNIPIKSMNDAKAKVTYISSTAILTKSPCFLNFIFKRARSIAGKGYL